MDVSRIEAVSPKTIDWRKLTAKEIIKYENQGVEVPTQYLQWAQQFIAEVSANDSDNTTYESATASSYGNNSVNSSNQSSTTAQASDSATQDKEKLTASQYRQQREAEGKGLYSIAKEFAILSAVKTNTSENASDISSTSTDSSADTIESLDSYMQDLMAQINDVKSKINSAKNRKDQNSISQVNKLKQQLKKLGQSGQVIAANSGADITNLLALVETQSGIAADGKDYGSATVDIGNEVKDTPSPWINNWRAWRDFANAVIKIGENTVSKSEQAGTDVLNAKNSISSNLDSVQSYQNSIQAQTGVGESSASDKNNDDDKNKDGSAKAESEKTVKTSQNDGTDTTDKMSTSIDEILKQKIRKGENIETS